MTHSEEVVASLNAVTVQNTAGQKILSQATMQLRRGEVTCLVGPSGSGKTTSALLLMGLMPQDIHLVEGSVTFQGNTLDPNQPEQFAGLRGKSLAIVFQDPYASLNPLRCCGPQIEDALILHGETTGEAITQRVMAQLRVMGFDDPERIYKSFPGQLSGGQRQRVMLALATILKPLLLIADEPTASLDAENQHQIVGLLQTLAREHGTAVLIISHDVGLVRSIGDYFFEIHEGVLKSVAPASLTTTMQSANVIFSSAPAPLLEVTALTKSYPKKALDAQTSRKMIVLKDISLQVGAGEIVGIFGPSGVGKTTLGRCIAGLETFDAGEILLSGVSVKPRGLRPHDGRIQMIYQSPASSLNPSMRVSKTIEEALQQAGVAASQYESQVTALLKQVGLPESAALRYPDSMSGGEKQRVAIARCLARRPQLIVADEPTASLDEKSKHLILDLLKRIVDDRHLSLILITHERELAWRYCDRVFEFSENHLVHKTQFEEGQI